MSILFPNDFSFRLLLVFCVIFVGFLPEPYTNGGGQDGNGTCAGEDVDRVPACAYGVCSVIFPPRSKKSHVTPSEERYMQREPHLPGWISAGGAL